VNELKTPAGQEDANLHAATAKDGHGKAECACHEDPGKQAQGTSNADENLFQSIRSLFFPDGNLIELTAEAPTFPKELLPNSGVRSEFAPEWPEGSRYLGVQCGDPGSGEKLVAVIIFTAGALQSLFKLNPGLRSALVTKWGPGLIVWLRVTGYPGSNVYTGSLTWFCRGVVPVAAYGLPVESFLVQTGLIPGCRFDHLKWDEPALGCFEIAEIEAAFGPPVKRTSSRNYRLNDVFWCELIVRRSKLRYDVYGQTFVRRDGDGLKHVTEGEVIQLVSRLLQSSAASLGERFPSSAVSLRWVQQLVRMMKARAAMTSLDDQMLIRQFLDENVERHPGSILLSDELLERFLSDCSSRNISAPSEALFFRSAAKRFGRTSHCFGPDGNARGRCGWRLKPQKGNP